MRPLVIANRRRVALPAGVLCLLICTGVAGADFGRLFFTPAERAALDQARAARAAQPGTETAPPDPPPVPVVAPAAVPPALPVLTLNGIVRRRDGLDTIWLNGMPGDAGATAVPGVRVRRAARGALLEFEAPQRAPPLVLKPGQRFDPATHTVNDAYAVPAADVSTP